MSFLEIWYPDERCASAFDIDYEGLYAQGIRGVMFDIDNTLVPHGADADERSIALMKRLREIGLDICFVSNNQRERVLRFNREIGAHVVINAHKPAKSGYLRGMALMGTDLASTLYVGDQIFTDVWGAKRLGMRNILTDPIDPREEIQIILKRVPERLILRSYEKHRHEGNQDE
ncbi:MAG: YqeG family HAD IIIA-type phosphatase [Lachnospiraceae bacterium]|nr:YqeG family HAD IIIA-type phosphatase [Lachnospiraceae bacterium]